MRNRQPVQSGLLRAALLLLMPVLGMISLDALADKAVITPYDSSRIVSIGGSITEILYALGLQQRIVAVDTTSLYPQTALQEKPNVGYMRQLSAEGVLSLSPTLILAIDGSGPKETIELLSQARIPFATIADKFTGDGIIDKISVISRDVGEPDRGQCLADMARRDLTALDTLRGHILRPVKVAFILSLANGHPMIAGRDTAADGIIAMAGARNAFEDFDGYKLVSDEAIVAAKPDAVLAMQRGEHALLPDTVFSQSAFAMTPAATHKVLISMDGLYLLGFGPRSPRAARDLTVRLYPDIHQEYVPSEQGSEPSQCSR